MSQAIKGSAIEALIPQRAPMIMIDVFYGFLGDEASYSGLTVSSENIFCQNDKLRESGIIEHIAQSAAARVGFIYSEKGEPIPLGFIGSVDKLKIYKLPVVGDIMVTRINVVQEVGDLSLISALTMVDGQKIAECRMKIFLQKN